MLDLEGGTMEIGLTLVVEGTSSGRGGKCMLAW